MVDKITLSQTRQAIAEEFYKQFEVVSSSDEGCIVMSEYVERFRNEDEVDNAIRQFITKSLNDYTESIVRMVEGMGKPGMEGGDRLLLEQQMGYQQALNDIKEELNDTK